ncbi:hypothetical protein BJP36_26540 [Moorena producens JHB]|uniref:Uncharacterized protein n=1 Tax=Moorena producens (strain JHB) TaxID=1454205 RepID=A0A1D9G5M2_MOOP1|nr:hypothetical protein [Moorena producens]AOY82942.1 hypothetical protein BJP36_26540 [Moorena producens JHB]
MKPFVPAALLILLVLPASALAQTIDVDANDQPLEITGWLGEENGFIGNVRLTASKQDVASFTFLPSDLKGKDTDQEITRQQVELIGDPQLSAAVPKDFQVKVNGIQSPGTYEGQIELLPLGQQRSEAVVIPLTVTAKARPKLVPLPDSEQLQLQLVQCSWWLDCGLAHLLLPASAFQNQWQLRFDNPVKATVSLRNAEVVLEGKQTGYQITETEVIPPKSPETLAANQIVRLPLQWERRQIPPDRYRGAVYLTLEGKEGRLAIPVNLSMRSGPLIPLLLLLVGIILGRLFKYMQEKGIPQADALGEVNRLEGKITEADPEDEKILTPMVKEVRKSVYQMNLDGVKADVNAIADRFNCLSRLRTMEQKLQPKKQHPKVGGENGILHKIAKARTLLSLPTDAQGEELEQVKALLAEIQSEVVQLGSSMMGRDNQPDAALMETAEEAEKAAAAVGHAVEAEMRRGPALPMWVVRLKRSLIVLSGVSSQVRAEATYWVVRPLLSLALLFGLSVVGIRALYVENGGTFGADPFADYWELVLWGLSADVASRSLSSLPKGEGKEE